MQLLFLSRRNIDIRKKKNVGGFLFIKILAENRLKVYNRRVMDVGRGLIPLLKTNKDTY